MEKKAIIVLDKQELQSLQGHLINLPKSKVGCILAKVQVALKQVQKK